MKLLYVPMWIFPAGHSSEVDAQSHEEEDLAIGVVTKKSQTFLVKTLKLSYSSYKIKNSVPWKHEKRLKPVKNMLKNLEKIEIVHKLQSKC